MTPFYCHFHAFHNRNSTITCFLFQPVWPLYHNISRGHFTPNFTFSQSFHIEGSTTPPFHQSFHYLSILFCPICYLKAPPLFSLHSIIPFVHHFQSFHDQKLHLFFLHSTSHFIFSTFFRISYLKAPPLSSLHYTGHSILPLFSIIPRPKL